MHSFEARNYPSQLGCIDRAESHPTWVRWAQLTKVSLFVILLCLFTSLLELQQSLP